MKNKHLFSFLALLASLVFSACSREDTLFSEPVYPEESLGTNTSAWVSPYQGKTRVIFENQRRERLIFSIETTPRTFVKSIFTDTRGETYTLRLRASDGNFLFELIPSGNQHLAFGTLENTRIFGNNLFFLSYSPFAGPSTYWTQYHFDGGRLADANYTYGSLYPKGGNDSFSTRISGDPVLSGLVLQQGEGLVEFSDKTGNIWRQIVVE